MDRNTEHGSNSVVPLWRGLWGKTSHHDGDLRYHPLFCHMLDVAAVAGLVWDRCLTPQFRKRIELTFGANTRSQIVFLAGAHDIGKANPSFQKKVPELAQNSGCSFSQYDQDRPHGFISAHVLNKAFGPCEASFVLPQIVGGHHGVFPRSESLFMGPDTLGDQCWETARRQLLTRFAGTVGFDLGSGLQLKNQITDPFVVPILAGFISVVDWIGSDQNFFPCATGADSLPGITPEEYWRYSNQQARKALRTLGWLPTVTFVAEAEFNAVFARLVPNIFQEMMIDLVSEQRAPYLIVIEAPTGEGKTEAALFAADMAMCRGFARGMYIAMPTQATGNAMYSRVLNDYLRHRGHQGKLNLQLVHGDALLTQIADAKEGEIPEFTPRSIEDGSDVDAQSWFSAAKRPLLAPFGVGTIDQSLLSVLQTKHWFVRLFGLAGKVVIFDEVHAYDAYMSVILERLLHWLAELDCTVILLSATLPEAKRRAVVREYSGRDDVEHKCYPRITLASPRHYPDPQAEVCPACVTIPKKGARAVSLRLGSTALPDLTATLSYKLERGGCATVICNTVNRSIEVYKHLRDNLKDTDCLLFHARTLRVWRREREGEVLRKFGKGERQPDGTYVNPCRPTRAVLVATQVVEQSLDLDFDLMVSEIAPIDLLLQRCGRLQRHARLRPANLSTPHLILLCDAKADGAPPESFGKGTESVYERYILLRTWLALRQRKRLEVPTEVEDLVESVYGESAIASGEEWDAALEDAKERTAHAHSESQKAAARLLVSQPKSPLNLIEEFNEQLTEDDDPWVHVAIRAATREGDPSITVVMLPADTILTTGPDLSEVRSLLDRSVKLSHRGIFHALLERGESPHKWSQNAHLRHACLLRLDEQNQGRVGKYVLTVDKDLGVLIEKDGENNG